MASIEYHLVSSGGRYVKLTGTAAAPVVERDVDINPNDNRRMYCIWSHDGGQTLWAGGDNYASPATRSHGLWKSEDGGATWIDKNSLLPGSLGYGEVWDISGWAGDPDWIAGVTNGAGTWYLCKYNSASDTLVIKETLPTSTSRPTSVWAVQGTDVAYSNCQWPRTIYRTLDRGETWTNDSSFPTSLESPCHIAADAAGNIYVHTLPNISTPTIWEGVWGGPWTANTDVLGHAYWNYGRHLCMDENGVPWDYTYNDERIWRRNPSSGVWEIQYGPIDYGASSGAFWVTSSGDILMNCSDDIDIYDGTTWYHYTAAGLGLTDGTYYGVWGRATDTAAPYLANLDPADGETEVGRYKSVSLDVLDDGNGVDGSSVTITLDGTLVWQNEAAEDPVNYLVTKTDLVDGYRYVIDPIALFAPDATISVAVYADGVGYPVSYLDTSYSFQIVDAPIAPVNLFCDYFDNGVVDLLTDLGNGGASEAAGLLSLTCGNGVNCYWYSGSNEHAPIAYEEINPYYDTPALLVVETRLADFTVGTNVDARVGLTLWVDRDNAYQFGYDDDTNDIRVYRILSDSGSMQAETGAKSSPATAPHVYRICYNNTDTGMAIPDSASMLEPGQVGFQYSVDDGETWSVLHIRTMDFSQLNLRFGVYATNWSPYPSVQADFDYLCLTAYYPDPLPSDQEDSKAAKAIVEDETLLPTAGGPPRHSLPQVGGGQRVPGPVDQPPGSIGPFDKTSVEDETLLPTAGGTTRHSLPLVGEGLLLSGEFADLQNKTSVQDSYQVLLSTLPDIWQGSPGSVDSEGHPHAVGGKMFRRAYYYCAEDEPWDRPELFEFDGYGRDGREYIAGQPHPVMTVTAPWALESASDDRSSRQEFPRNSLLVSVADNTWTDKELNIYDLDNYVPGDITTLKLWMRFKLNTGNNAFYLIGNENRGIVWFTMKNGMLYLINKNNSARGGIITVDFRAAGQDFTSMVRSDDDWVGVVGRDITDRNTTGNTTTTGGTGARIRSEDPSFVDAYGTSAGRSWAVVCGEDRGPDIVHYTGGSAVRDSQAAGPDIGSDGDGLNRRAFFGKDGWLWFAIDRTLYRNLTDYADGVMIADTRSRLNRSVTLPYAVDYLAESRDHVFVGTTVGVYKIDKVSLDFYLAYTAAGGGGGGKDNQPPEGEILAGPTSDTNKVVAFDGGLSGYLAVSTFSYAVGGAFTIIRLFDDWVAASYVYPELYEDPGPKFGTVFRR